MVRRARSDAAAQLARGAPRPRAARDRPAPPQGQRDARRAAEQRGRVDPLPPDAAAREAVAAVTNPKARIIDGSTAHRVDPGWVYGVPELCEGQRTAIASAARVTNPGCYPTGVSLLVRPLVDAGLLAPDAPLAIHALSGYSGGGQSMIDRWESANSACAPCHSRRPTRSTAATSTCQR